MEGKIDSELLLALDVPETERIKTDDLNVGYSDGVWELIVRYSRSIVKEVNELNGSIKELLGGYGLVRIPRENIDRLSEIEGVLFIEKPRSLQYELLYSKIISCIEPDVNRDENGGEGVYVAVIDSGIDYLHPDFIVNGRTRLAVIYDEVTGRVYSREDIDNAIAENDRSLIIDKSGHGTTVAGIAAGNNGVAFKSDIIVVKLGEDNFFNTARLMEGVDFALRYAMENNRPIAINISIGNNYGAHDGTSLFETYIDYVTEIWKNNVIVGAGNEADKRIHAVVNLNDRSEVCEFSVGNYEESLAIQIWKRYWDDFYIGIETPSGERFVVPKGESIYEFKSLNELIYVYVGTATPYSYNSETLIQIIPDNAYIKSGIWQITFYPDNIKDGRIDLWISGRTVLTGQTGFAGAVPETTLTIPSTSYRVITVGAYNGRTFSYAPFSGRGNTKNLVTVKPDISAPGVDISSPYPGGGYRLASGTSVAAPFVTGAAAILMEWGIVKGNDLFMYGERLKAKLIKDSIQNSGQNVWPNRLLGWGLLCLKII